MALSFPYLAKQINGPVAKSLGYGVDSVYEMDAFFIEFLSRFSIDSLEGEWLDKLGILLGLPRPWVEIPMIEEALLFDNIPPVVPNPVYHAISTDRNIIIGDILVTPSMGGKLDNLYRSISVEPTSDSTYRQFLKAACLVKRKHSVVGIANVVEVFSGSKQYAIEFLKGSYEQGDWMNDILVKLPIRLLDYQQTLQKAFDNMFTTAPKVLVRIDALFDSEYIVPNVKEVIFGIVGNDSYSVTNFTELDYLVIDVTLGSVNASFKDDVKAALDEEYGGYYDITISVTVANGR